MCRRKACGMLILCKLFLSAIIKFTEKKKKKLKPPTYMDRISEDRVL